jgi:hypothetical protein
METSTNAPGAETSSKKHEHERAGRSNKHEHKKMHNEADKAKEKRKPTPPEAARADNL